MSAFDEDLFLKGLEQRKATQGTQYVERNLAAADDFSKPFQQAMTAWCWSFGWGDDVIDAKTRSMMNLSMIGALGKHGRVGAALPWCYQQWRHKRKDTGHHSRYRDLLRRPSGAGVFSICQ